MTYEWKNPADWDEILKQSNEFDVAWQEWKRLGQPLDDSFLMPDNPVIGGQYRGWACTHGPAETHPEHNHTGKSTEDLIFEINMIGGSVNIAVDQWWGIRTKLHVENWQDEGDPNWVELEFDVYIQADELHDGLEKMYDVVKSRWEFHKGRSWT
jgi:hypothetical protein